MTHKSSYRVVSPGRKKRVRSRRKKKTRTRTKRRGKRGGR